MRAVQLSLVLVLVLAACGGDAVGPDLDGSPMSATIDGVRWAAASTPGAVAVIRTELFVVIGGSDVNLVAVSLSMPAVSAPGTYPLVPPTAYHGLVQEQQERTWTSGQPGGSGSVTITSVSDARIAGTFEFAALPAPGTSATGTRQVTNGRFDVTF
jgi:hypothetical protein